MIRKAAFVTVAVALLATLILIGTSGSKVNTGAKNVEVFLNFVGENDGDSAGREVAGIGDVDCDGVQDWAVGAPGKGNLRGAAYIYSGATGKLLHTFEGPKSGIVFGRAIAGIGDVDKDGCDDFAIGAPQFDFLAGSEDHPDTGYIAIYSGKSGKLLREYYGDAAGDNLGKAISSAGDLDGDGIPDILVSAPGRLGFTGTVFVYSGADGKILQQYDGKEVGGRYGWSVAGGQDVDGDGIPDVIIGAPWSSNNGKVNSGSVFVYSGASRKLLYRLDGEAAGDGFGSSVSFVGDIMKEGRAAFVVGSPLANPKGIQDAGSAFVYSGSGKLLYRFDGETPTGILGFSVAGAGDLDGDSVPDIVVGGQWTRPGGLYNSGSASAFSGATGKLLFRFDGLRKSAEYGFAVSSWRDSKGAPARIIIGAPGDRDFAGAAVVVGLSQRSPAYIRLAKLWDRLTKFFS